MNIVFDPNDDGNLLITLGTLTPIPGDLLMVYAFKDKYQILISNHRLQNKCYLCARYDEGQIVGADEIFRALRHPHAQQNIVDAGSCGAVIAAEQLQRCALPHHGHAVGEGAVHVENPLLAVHLSSS